MTPTDLGTILAVWAHPDDETFTCGGLMAAASDAGQRVVCATATAGEHGTGDAERWPPARLAQVRRWESAAAMAVLGVAEHEIAGLPDGGLRERTDDGLAWVSRLFDEVQPDTVITFDRDGGTFHPDHIAVHGWVTEAWERRGRPCRLLYAVTTAEHLAEYGPLYDQWGVFMTESRPTGVPEADLALLVRLEGTDLDRKVTALRAMASQTAEVVAGIDLDLYAAIVADEPFVAAG